MKKTCALLFLLTFVASLLSGCIVVRDRHHGGGPAPIIIDDGHDHGKGKSKGKGHSKHD